MNRRASFVINRSGGVSKELVFASYKRRGDKHLMSAPPQTVVPYLGPCNVFLGF